MVIAFCDLNRKKLILFAVKNELFFFITSMGFFETGANLVNIFDEKVSPAKIAVKDQHISKIEIIGDTVDPNLPYILPGFIDAHVHVESSMLVPSEFARLAVIHGTVATVSDPHEIANVLGIEGVDFMLQNGAKVPFKFYFGAPSCVPATPFETAGAELDAPAVDKLLQRDEIVYLSEMMNFPGVLQGDEEVFRKIEAAKKQGKPIDGHAPGLRGDDARHYAEAGSPGEVTISSDHECFTKKEALDKLEAGMNIIIREGSAARNFEALIPLLNDYPDRIMFCSDDKHPDSLVEGHINELVKRALEKDIPLYHCLKAACINPVEHYNLDVGLLREGDTADFILVKDLKHFHVLETVINGQKVASNGKTDIETVDVEPVNKFNCSPKIPSDFQIKSDSAKVNVIEALDGELITNAAEGEVIQENGLLFANLEKDILKITVVNRYGDAPPAAAFIKNFGLERGAIASSVAHDSHNIIAVGCDDDSLCGAVNLLIKHQGGICAVKDEKEKILPLPVSGLMSAEDGYKVAKKYSTLDQTAREMGSKLESPFMTLSFMALLVIPHLKLSDKGLFDGDKFEFVGVTV